MADELFSLNETGEAIWNRLDGKMTLEQGISSLADEYEASPYEIQRDVIRLMEELERRKMLVEVSPN